VRAARAAANGGCGELHVGYAPSPTVRILPAVLRAFQGRLPGARVKLHDLSTEEMLAGVREGKLQLAFIVRPTRPMLRGVCFEELARDAMCLAVPLTHPFARLRSVPLAKVAREPLLVMTRKDYPEYHEYLDRLFAGVAGKPRIVGEHDSGTSLVAAIEAGCGVAVAPQSLACSVGSRLKLIALWPTPAPLVLGAVWLEARLTAAGEQFLKSAREVASTNQPPLPQPRG
jgi:DNA-binding transcriptional LysR family regulator